MVKVKELIERGLELFSRNSVSRLEKFFESARQENLDISLRQHTSNGRFNPKTDVKIDLHKDIDYAKARAYEQYYIEKYKTIDKTNPKANQQNSFRHNRTDARGKGFEAEYKKIKYQ